MFQVFVHERDIWLAHALSVSEKMAMHHAPQLTANGVTHILPSVVVAVVGMGHQPGIINEWKKIEESQLSVTHTVEGNLTRSQRQFNKPGRVSKVLSFPVRQGPFLRRPIKPHYGPTDLIMHRPAHKLS